MVSARVYRDTLRSLSIPSLFTGTHIVSEQEKKKSSSSYQWLMVPAVVSFDFGLDLN